MPLSFQWVRPKPYPDTPKTLGEHLFRRRSLAGLTQAQVACQIGVNTWTYLLWETNRTAPTVRYWPALFTFLGYDPFPAPATLSERIAAKRREIGLSIKAAANVIGVDEGTLRRWESGEWKPRFSVESVSRLLRMPQQFSGLSKSP